MLEIVGALRFTVTALMGAVALVAIIGLCRRNYMAPVVPINTRGRWIGVALFSAGWCLHQMYWFWWHLARLAKRQDLAAALEHGDAWVMAAIYPMIAVGAAMLLHGFLHQRFGPDHWMWAAVAVVVTLMMLGLSVSLGAKA